MTEENIDKLVDVLKDIPKKLITEFQDDLDSLNEFPSLIPYSFEPLRKLKEKWEARQNAP